MQYFNYFVVVFFRIIYFVVGSVLYPSIPFNPPALLAPHFHICIYLPQAYSPGCVMYPKAFKSLALERQSFRTLTRSSK